jgi:hypothetical protein
LDEQDETSVPTDELEDDPEALEEEVETGIQVNTDQEVSHARSLLMGFDYERDDGNWGIEVYIEVLHTLAAHNRDETDEALSAGFRS